MLSPRLPLTCDDYGAYDVVFKLEDRIEAGCMAHARRRFDELLKALDRAETIRKLCAAATNLVDRDLVNLAGRTVENERTSR